MGKEQFFIITTLIVGIVTALPVDKIIRKHAHKITHTSAKDISNLSSLLPSQSTCGMRKAPSLRIVGGIESQLGAWPWMVALGYKYKSNEYGNSIKWLCSGTLISNKHVLTASSCVTNIGTNVLTTARLGDLNLDPKIDDGATPLDVPIQRIIPHKHYSSRNFTNDIALLVLKNSINFTALIQPICLPQLPNIKNMDLGNSFSFIAGWGITQYRGEKSSTLMEARIPITNITDCKKAYKNYTNQVVINDRVICAGEEGKDSSSGDGGGPLMWFKEKQFYLMGIVSFGQNSYKHKTPGVYTRVSYFLDWILERI